jgi:hypothetical protein
MSKKSTTICSWNSNQLKAKNLLPIVQTPKYYCRECGRVAKKKKWLCMPKELYKHQSENFIG